MKVREDYRRKKKYSSLEPKIHRAHFLKDERGKEHISLFLTTAFVRASVGERGHLRVSTGRTLPLRR